jgi:hypothetical protein
MISVRFEAEQAIKKYRGMEKQLPYALSVAINRTANDVKQAEIDEIKRVIDNPTPYILKAGVYVRYSNKARLQAEIKLNDKAGRGTPVAKILAAHIEGGARSAKPFELWLQSRGYMPHGWKLVPSRELKLDRYGNISNAKIRQIMSGLGSGPNDKGKAFFIMKNVGIYERYGKGRNIVKPVAVFVEQASYKAKYEYVEVGKRAVRRNFSKQFERAYIEAARTAR